MALAIAQEASFRARPFDAEQADDPIELFRIWYNEAVQTEPNDPNAVALATASASGVPSARMVLMKRLDQRGFSFYTNAESRKGKELSENPRAAMCFHWKTQRRQVCVQGVVSELPSDDADAYFHSRSRGSQIAAAVSAQSRPLESREKLERAALELDAHCSGEIPRPADWRGYVLAPESIEFWQDGAYRMHDRMVFVRTDKGWKATRLYP